MKNTSKILVFVIIVLSIISCKTAKERLEADKLCHYTIIAFNPKDGHPVFDNSKPASLTYAEILELENIIKPKIIKNLSQHKYFRQYIAATNSVGEKLVRINFICEGYYDPGYETHIAEATDGGNCFFQVKVNFTKKDCYFYMENMDG